MIQLFVRGESPDPLEIKTFNLERNDDNILYLKDREGYCLLEILVAKNGKISFRRSTSVEGEEYNLTASGQLTEVK